VRGSKRGRAAFIISFLAPSVALYGLFVVWPFLQTFYLSVFRFRGVSSKRTFVGAQYFEALTKDDVFIQCLKNVGFLLVVGGGLTLILSLALAHALQSKGPMAKFLRGVYLFPQVISVVAVAVLWRFIYQPQGGLLNGILKPLGISAPENGWLGSTGSALPSVTVAWIWLSLGFYTMLFSAGIKGIPEEVKEAAALEGLHGWRKFWAITWPLLWSIKRVAVVYIVINVMNVFGLVYVMTQGQPARKTETLLTYLYEQSILNSKFGYAAALATVNFVIILAISLLIMLAFRRDPQGARP